MAQEYISREGLERLKIRLQNLIQNERPAIIEQIIKAREFGDLSENAEYHAAKQEQRFIEMKITKLQQKIATLNIINSDKINKNEVRFGAKVELYDLNRKISVTYKIVGEDETGKVKNVSPVRNKSLNGVRKISCNSPIARALLGKKVSEEVMVKVPAGIIKYKIKNIKY
jgi:transcription elongation factor GreA